MKMFLLSLVMLFAVGAVRAQEIAINSSSSYKSGFNHTNQNIAGTNPDSNKKIINGQPQQYLSLPTDHFRSYQTGNWADFATWESSSDGGLTWVTPVTFIPDTNSASITIMSGHTVSLTNAAFTYADQLTILPGGTLIHDNSVGFYLNDGPGTDMTIDSGGTYILNGTQPQKVSLTFTIDVKKDGLVRVDSDPAGGSTDFASGAAFGFVNFENGSIYEWNTTFQPKWWNGRSYFTPGHNTIYKFSKSPALPMGGDTATIIYGNLEANVPLSITGSGTKTFTNGIRGTGSVTALITSGKFIINGTTAELGGSGSLTVPPSGGLEIGSASGTVVTVTSNKTVTGDISLISTSYVDLGINNLTVTGTITGGGTTAFIKTSGMGVLTLNTVFSKTFPIGNSSYNPLVISSGGGINYSARVETGISPVANSFPTYGINRTWDIQASAVNAAVIVAFQYATADANAGALPQPQAMEILLYSGSAWSIIPGNVNINPTPAGSAWVVTTATGLSIPFASSTPYALGKNGGWFLPIDCIISTRVQKINNTGIISWTVNSCTEVRSFEVQRSVNNSGFQTIGTVNPVFNQTDFSFTDAALAGGRNLYRIKVNGITGLSKYSNTVVLIHNSNDILISAFVPNPVHDKALLTVSSGRNAAIDFKIYNAAGNLVKQWSSVVTEGNNTIEVNAAGLAAGIYTVFASSNESKTVSRFVKQ